LWLELLVANFFIVVPLAEVMCLVVCKVVIICGGALL
jgi:hypothetical protein